jgi:hypothetical protein
MQEKKDLSQKYVYLKIEMEIFQNMQITKGSKLSCKEESILNELVKEHNPTARIFTSTISNK